MQIHILGICGTFMAGVALLARELGHTVAGSDTNVYPPMSTLLAGAEIEICEGFATKHLQPSPDLVIVGNALSRGNPAVEYVLDNRLTYTSGPQWIAEHVLSDRWVLAVAGTHGKTTTTSMLAWILEESGNDPGFLIGGVANNFDASARLGAKPFFVIEADEYDTAFFDKRSKFVHYSPQTLLINNLEFDHADIFPDLQAIQRQFHQLIRTVPANGQIIVPANDATVSEVLDLGCWTPVHELGTGAGAAWTYRARHPDYSAFEIRSAEHGSGSVEWSLCGEFNARNALAAIACAQHAGIEITAACAALNDFTGVKRRLEFLAEVGGVRIYDDFAHHPTAIAAAIAALRERSGNGRLLAVLEPRSHTMLMGHHANRLASSLQGADNVMLFVPPDLSWDIVAAMQPLGACCTTYNEMPALLDAIAAHVKPNDHVVIMSNGAFHGLHDQLIERLHRTA